MNSTYLGMVILCIAFFILIIYMIYMVKKEGWRKTAINLIVQVEERMGSGYGKEKMEMVVDALIKLLPAPFRLFITAELAEEFIQSVFDEVKVALDYREEQNNG